MRRWSHTILNMVPDDDGFYCSHAEAIAEIERLRAVCHAASDLRMWEQDYGMCALGSKWWDGLASQRNILDAAIGVANAAGCGK